MQKNKPEENYQYQSFSGTIKSFQKRLHASVKKMIFFDEQQQLQQETDEQHQVLDEIVPIDKIQAKRANTKYCELQKF